MDNIEHTKGKYGAHRVQVGDQDYDAFNIAMGDQEAPFLIAADHAQLSVVVATTSGEHDSTFPTLAILGEIFDRNRNALERDYDDEHSMVVLAPKNASTILEMISGLLFILMTSDQVDSVMKLIVQIYDQNTEDNTTTEYERRRELTRASVEISIDDELVSDIRDLPESVREFILRLHSKEK